MFPRAETHVLSAETHVFGAETQVRGAENIKKSVGKEQKESFITTKTKLYNKK